MYFTKKKTLKRKHNFHKINFIILLHYKSSISIHGYVLNTTLGDKFIYHIMVFISSGLQIPTPIITDRDEISEIVLKVALKIPINP